MDRANLFIYGLIALWTSIALGLLGAVLMIVFNFSMTGNWPLDILLVAIASLLLAFLAYKISMGRNWARIALLVLFAIGLPSALISSTPFLLVASGQVPIGTTSTLIVLASAQRLVVTALQTFALYTFFSKPGALKFQRQLDGMCSVRASVASHKD